MSVRIEWRIGGLSPQKHFIYRSQEEIDVDNLPSPIGEVGANFSEFVDQNGNEGDFYLVVAEKNGLLCPAAFSVEAVGFMHDIFFDGSAIATYKLDGDVSDFGGGADAGNMDGEFQGIGLRLHNDQGYSRLNTPTLDRQVVSVSMVIRTENFGGRSWNHIADFRLGNGNGYYTLNSSGAYTGSLASNFHLNGNSFNGSLPYNQEVAHLYFELDTPSNAITFGNRHASSSTIGSINAEIANIRLFDRSLSIDEIQELSDIDTRGFL